MDVCFLWGRGGVPQGLSRWGLPVPQGDEDLIAALFSVWEASHPAVSKWVTRMGQAPWTHSLFSVRD